MVTTPAKRVLDVWSFRLKMDDDRGKTWSTQLRSTVEHLVERLAQLPSDAAIAVEPRELEENSDLPVRLILVQSGEILAEFWKQPRQIN